MNKPQILLSSDFKECNTREECDCACGDAKAYNLNSRHQAGTWGYCSDLHIQSIIKGYDLVFNTRTNTDIALVNAPAMIILKSFRTPKNIRRQDNVIEKMIRANILESVDGDTAQSFSAQQRTLVTWLHVTARCNLRCSYCYLPHIYDDMTYETGKTAVDSIYRLASLHRYKRVKIKYSGGEPLFVFPMLVKIHKHASQLTEEQNIALDEVVLSNGTLLTPEFVQILLANDMRLMISMDGLGRYHDAHRSYAGGRGSFSDVSEAVELALSYGLVPQISVTVSTRTIDGLPAVIEWILDRKLPFSLNFYRENKLSDSNIDMRLDEEKIISGMLSAFKVIESSLPKQNILPSIVDRADLSVAHTHTCGVGQNYLVFDQYGQVAKCQMHISRPVTNMRVDDPLSVLRADQSGVQNISVEEKEGCKSCEWKYWCAGGCPVETYRVTGRYDVKSPNCNIYKALFPEALRLEGLRLLKYQDDPEVVQKIEL